MGFERVPSLPKRSLVPGVRLHLNKLPGSIVLVRNWYQPGSCRRPSRAIIIVGAFVFSEVMEGMIEASTTRKPPMPCTFRCWSTTAPTSSAGPILAVPAQ